MLFVGLAPQTSSPPTSFVNVSRGHFLVILILVDVLSFGAGLPARVLQLLSVVTQEKGLTCVLLSQPFFFGVFYVVSRARRLQPFLPHIIGAKRSSICELVSHSFLLDAILLVCVTCRLFQTPTTDICGNDFDATN